MKPRAVEIHPEAVLEARAARQWYETKSQDAALAFMAKLDAGVDSIRVAPELYPPYLHGTRCCLMRRFPYLIVYTATPRR
jgi:toxin ParE1/3/4